MKAICGINNCQRSCPDDEPFCAKHREPYLVWKAELTQAKASIAELRKDAEFAIEAGAKWQHRAQSAEAQIAELEARWRAAGVERNQIRSLERRAKARMESQLAALKTPVELEPGDLDRLREMFGPVIGGSRGAEDREAFKHRLLSALKAESGAGWKWVPVEPTEAMLGAALSLPGPAGTAILEAYYRAMLAASPPRGEG